VRFNARIGRFVKSATEFLPWHDDLYYLQAQAYWIRSCRTLGSLLADDSYAERAVAGSEEILARQRPDGAWDYPNPEWKGRVATVEGTWASIGLLDAFRRTGESRFLEGALGWNRFMDDAVGYVPSAGGLAVNYFAGRSGVQVPNNSTLVLWFLAELAGASGDVRIANRCGPLVDFLAAGQRPSGELPYSVDGPTPHVEHFQCFQYNAFECLDLVYYRDVSGDDSVSPLIDRVRTFLRSGVEPDGHVRYDCSGSRRRVTYHASVVAATLSTSPDEEDRVLADRIFEYVLGLQRGNGSFPYSRGDYGFLRDNRSYPRQLAMLLSHLFSAEGER
jgi:hypothetical protein